MLGNTNSVISRIFAAATAQTFSRAVGIVIQIFSAPLFIWHWGVHIYGEWLLLTTIPAYLTMTDIGFSAASANEMTMSAARGDKDSAIRVFKDCLTLTCILGALVILLSLLLVEVLPIRELLGIKLIDERDTHIIIMVFALQAAISLPGELLLGGFRAANKYATGIFSSSGFLLLEFAIMFVVVTLGYSPVYAAFSLLIGRLIRIAASALIMKKIAPWLHFRFSTSIYELKKLLWPAIGFASFPIAAAFNSQGMIILIGNILGPVAVVAFTTTRTLARFVSIFSELASQSTLSEISIAFAKRNFILIQKIHLTVTQINFWTTLSSGAILISFSGLIYTLWLHGKVEPDFWLIFILILSEAALAVYKSSLLILTSSNNHTKAALAFTAQAFLGICLAFYGLHAFGIVGAALALLTTNVLFFCFVLYEALLVTKMPGIVFLRQMMIPPLGIVARKIKELYSPRLT